MKASPSSMQVTTSVLLYPDIAETVLNIAEHGEEPDEVAVGTPFEGADVIVMATHGRGGLGRWLVGSVTERVLEGSPLPLLITRPAKVEQEAATVGSQRAQGDETGSKK